MTTTRVLLGCAALALGIAASSCTGKAEPPHSDVVRAERVATLPTDPDDPAWRKAPLHAAAMIPQDLVEPRLLTPSTAQVAVQALQDGSRIVFRLSWVDPGKNDLPGAARFTDACAVQLPVKAEADVPAPQMGEKGKPVEILYWSASAQAAVNGRPDDIHSFYPNAKVDHYPAEAAPLEKGSPEQIAMAARYSPARALGNVVSVRSTRPVQELLAEGPGTLSPAPAGPGVGSADGKGRHDGDGWAVLLSRPLPAQLGANTQAAFAVWQGEESEVGSRKMRTGWIPVVLETKP